MPQYIVKKYTNPQQTKVQVMELETDNFKDAEHVRAQCAMYMQAIDPSLTWLFEISYLDENRQKLYTDMFDINGKFIRRDEPWKYGRGKYTAGGFKNEEINVL